MNRSCRLPPKLVVLLGAGCTDTVLSNGRLGGIWGPGDIAVTHTTADLRAIIERPGPRGVCGTFYDPAKLKQMMAILQPQTASTGAASRSPVKPVLPPGGLTDGRALWISLTRCPSFAT